MTGVNGLKMSKKIIGYTQGVYDMFHVGHLNLLKHAKENCDFLIVGVNSDELTEKYKSKKPVVPEGERRDIVEAIKYVDKAVIANIHDKFEAYKKHNFDVIFVGDDHKGEPKWQELEKKLDSEGARVFYLPYTQHTSSTILRKALDDVIQDSSNE